MERMEACEWGRDKIQQGKLNSKEGKMKTSEEEKNHPHEKGS